MPEGPGPTDAAPTPPARLRTRALVSVAVLAGIVYAAFLAVSDVQSLSAEFGRLDAWAFGAALALALVGYALRGLRWHLFLRHLGVSARYWDSLLTFVSGFALGVTPGKLGELVRIYYARVHVGASYSVALSAAIAERVLDVAAVVLLFSAGLFVIPVLGPLVGWLLLAVAAAAILLLRSRSLAGRFFELLERILPLRKLVATVRGVHEGIRPLLSGKVFATGLLLSLLAWAAEVWAVWLLAQSLDIDLSLAASSVVFMGASMAGVLSFLPGGLGATEGGMVALLLLLGVPVASAGALTIAARLATLWFSVLVGGIAIVLLRRARGEVASFEWTKPRAAWLPRVDGAVMAGLFGLTILLRWPLRSRYLNAWDSTSFALALEEYDVLAQRPHAPGYPLFIALGRLMRFVLPEANAALVGLGILFSAAAVALLYGLVREFGSRRAALFAALLFAFAPVFVFNGLIALSYTSEACASVALAWMAWRVAARPTNRGLALLGALWALAVGLRQSLFLFLAPLVVWAVAMPGGGRASVFRRGLVGFGSAAFTALLWFLPMVASTTDGLRGWRRAMAVQGDVVLLRESIFVRGPEALREHASRVGFYLRSEQEALLLLAALAAAALLAVRGRTFLRPQLRLFLFLAAWLAPALLFYLTVFSGWDKGPTGYILVVLPGLYLCFALLVDASLRAIVGRFHAQSRPRLVAAALAWLVLPIPLVPLHEDWRAWTETEIRDHDEWVERWNAIRGEYPPNETAILTFYSWAHVKWYFPDYLVWGYFPIPRNADPPDWELFLETRNHTDDVLFYEAHERGPGQPPHDVPPWARTVIVFDFQLAGENGGPRRLRDEVAVTEARLADGWRLLVFHPEAGATTIESYFQPLAATA